jgi:hypothetical protein
MFRTWRRNIHGYRRRSGRERSRRSEEDEKNKKENYKEET